MLEGQHVILQSGQTVAAETSSGLIQDSGSRLFWGKVGDNSRQGQRKPCWELGRNTNSNSQSRRLWVLQPLLCMSTSPLGDAAARTGTRGQALARFLQRERALPRRCFHFFSSPNSSCLAPTLRF